MKLSLIWAMDRNRVIGKNNTLPWKLPADMQWFRKQTMGKPILMGRKTFESIGRPLPGRMNLVLSRQRGLSIAGCTVVHSLQEARDAVADSTEMMVIGGAEIYALLLPHADSLYITHVEDSFDGDTWFPRFNSAAWRQILDESHPSDEKNTAPYRFEVWERSDFSNPKHTRS
ncbi:MAG: type 3 dihydrofolate reductase [Mariprofundaceae bacterium]|nr:type 3 dihydrofolate reductase [Mariprofundaceae bacterium]